MKLKPLPKFLGIAVITGAVGYGISIYLEKKEAEAAKTPVVVEQPQPTKAVQAPEQPAQTAAPQPQSSQPSDAGIKAILGK